MTCRFAEGESGDQRFEGHTRENELLQKAEWLETLSRRAGAIGARGAKGGAESATLVEFPLFGGFRPT